MYLQGTLCSVHGKPHPLDTRCGNTSLYCIAADIRPLGVETGIPDSPRRASVAAGLSSALPCTTPFTVSALSARSPPQPKTRKIGLTINIKLVPAVSRTDAQFSERSQADKF